MKTNGSLPRALPPAGAELRDEAPLVGNILFNFRLIFYSLPLLLCCQCLHEAYLIVVVPGGNEGPSGVLICSENYITYKNFGDQPDIRCPIPRRRVRMRGKLHFLLECLTHTYHYHSCIHILPGNGQTCIALHYAKIPGI